MDSLKLFKIEAVVVDDQLSKDIIAKRLGSFVISMSLTELDPTGAVEKKASAPASQPVKKAKKVKSAPNPSRHRTRSLTEDVAKRIEVIKSVMGTSEMNIKEVAKASRLPYNKVVHALLIGEQKRIFACKMVKVRSGVRPLRYFTVIR